MFDRMNLTLLENQNEKKSQLFTLLNIQNAAQRYLSILKGLY